MTPLARTTILVTGPVRSGKSRHAEDLLARHAEVVYVATGRPSDLRDPEWSARVQEHLRRRPAGWRTVESSAVAAVVAEARGPVLVDCLGTWLAAVVDETGWDDLDSAESVVRAQSAALIDALGAASVPIVVVTNEVGWSLVATTASGRFFADELGRLNAAVSRVASAVHLVVAGRVLDLTNAAVVPPDLRPRTLDA